MLNENGSVYVATHDGQHNLTRPGRSLDETLKVIMTAEHDPDGEPD
jgi:hypothetical protein